MDKEYVLDPISDKDYFILSNGDSNIKYSKKANTLDNIIAWLISSGVESLRVLTEKEEKCEK